MDWKVARSLPQAGISASERRMGQEHERRSHVLAPEDQLGEFERDLAIVDHFGDGSCNTTGLADVSMRGLMVVRAGGRCRPAT